MVGKFSAVFLRDIDCSTNQLARTHTRSAAENRIILTRKGQEKTRGSTS